jgi:hypothetical protein
VGSSCAKSRAPLARRIIAEKLNVSSCFAANASLVTAFSRNLAFNRLGLFILAATQRIARDVTFLSIGARYGFSRNERFRKSVRQNRLSSSTSLRRA